MASVFGHTASIIGFNKLFPENGLQERKENFLGIYLKHGRELFEVLKENLDPLDKNFTVFCE